MFHKKLYPFIFAITFYIHEPIFIIFGKNVAKKLVICRALRAVIYSSNVFQLRTSLSVAGVAENMWCSTLKIAF